jgi:uncharacterized protein YqjF (DUF2071 family)
MKTFLKAEWENLIMANYEVEPSVLEPYLPKGVELDYFEGKTYVSLVGFLFKDTRIFNVPIPVMGTFEEVNLRFYVLRKIGNKVKRGVVFINETVPSKIVALVANTLYKEHYSVVPTKHSFGAKEPYKEIEYQWKVKGAWNKIKVKASIEKTDMQSGSFEEFIFEHYYGYSKLSDKASSEYTINHPSWKINAIKEYEINCDFSAFYGEAFKDLNQASPRAVFLAEGSGISVDWKRTKF